MIIDTQTLFSDDQAITATARSTNNVDMGVVAAKAAIGTPENTVEVLCQVTADFDSGADDGTLVVALATDEALPMDGSSVVLHQTAAIAEATLVAGYQFSLGFIPVHAARYLDMNFTVAGSGNFTAGKITAGLVLAKQTNG